SQAGYLHATRRWLRPPPGRGPAGCVRRSSPTPSGCPTRSAETNPAVVEGARVPVAAAISPRDRRIHRADADGTADAAGKRRLNPIGGIEESYGDGRRTSDAHAARGQRPAAPGAGPHVRIAGPPELHRILLHTADDGALRFATVGERRTLGRTDAQAEGIHQAKKDSSHQSSPSRSSLSSIRHSCCSTAPAS